MDNNSSIFFALAIVVIVIIILFILNYSSINIDNFNSKFGFCDSISFAAIIDQSYYFSSLNKTDLKKRRCRTNDQYKFNYKRSFCNFTDVERDRLTKLTNKALNILPGGIVNKVKWSYAKIGVDFEMGLPHTLGDRSSGVIVCICPIPLTILGDVELLEIICHEIVHVYQRLWESDYTRLVESLGFVNYNINSDTYDFLYGNYVKAANPDTWDYWVYNGCILLSVYFGEELDNMDATYNLATGKTVLGGLDMGCNLIQQDHPFEIVAASIAKIAIGKSSDIRPDWLSIFSQFDY